MIPKKFPFAKYDFVDGRFEVYCVTEDWDCGEFSETFFFHFLNIFPRWKVMGADEK